MIQFSLNRSFRSLSRRQIQVLEVQIIYPLQRIVARIPVRTVSHHRHHRIETVQLPRHQFGKRQSYVWFNYYRDIIDQNEKKNGTCDSWIFLLLFQTPNSSSNNNGAPPVPQRHSSMRNSNGAQATIVQHQQATIVTTVVTPNSTRTVNRFVMDLEAKFGHSFHNVTEFPPPQPFTKYDKSYPSRNMKATTGTFWN